MVIITDDLRDMRISIIFSFALILFILVCLMLPSKVLPASFGQSHETHWWDDRGPRFWTTFPNPPMGCTNCHYDDTPHHGNPYQFADMQDFANTTVCDGCHSQGGAYDGVAMGKTNWNSGIYTGDNLEVLPPGKEQWCVTCHDNAAPTINGVTAKNISGNDITYGYFISGHGSYNVSCTECHDPTLVHLDTFANTYTDDEDENGPLGYRQAYRLNVVAGQNPLDIPRTGPYNASQFALCYSCHNEAKIMTSNFNNFFELLGLNSQTNWHGKAGSGHLLYNGEFWDSDRKGFDFSTNSYISCPACHNPHGKDYDGRATFSMTRQDLGIVHKREVIRTRGYMENGAWLTAGGDLQCFGCHQYGPEYEYYYRLGTPPPENPAFWTKLDSENDISSPTFGDGGSFFGGSFANYTFYGESRTGLNSVTDSDGCEFPTSNINKYDDTIEFWYVPNFNLSGNTITRYIFDHYVDDNNWTRIGVVNAKIHFSIKNAGVTHSLETANLNWLAGTPHHIVCTYGPAQGMHIYLDKVEPSYTISDGLTYLAGIDQLPLSFYIGSRHDGLNPAGGIIDDFKIYGYQYQKFESDLALFSKMGSLQEIQNPVIGIGGGVAGSVGYSSTIAQHGSSSVFNSSASTGAVQFPTSNLNNDEDTIDFWYYPSFKFSQNTETNQRHFYCGKDVNNYVIIGISTNRFGFRIVEDLDGDGTPTNHTLLTTALSEGTLSTGPWFHIVCTWGPAGMHIYIDDKEATYSTSDGLSYTGPLFPTGMPIGNFMIGNRSAGTPDTSCDGYIDELRVYGYQGSPSYLEFLVDCPVDIQVIDPLGRIVDKFQNEIRGSQYIEHDFNGDGSLDDKIIVPKRNGNYTVSVFPEPGANPEDTYTLKVIDGENTIILVKDEPVGNISGENTTEITVTSSGLKFIKLLTPKNGESLSGPVTFDWESVGYDRFRLIVAPIARNNRSWTWLSETEYTPTDAEWQTIQIYGARGNLSWKVIGIDSDGYTGSSETRKISLPRNRAFK